MDQEAQKCLDSVQGMMESGALTDFQALVLTCQISHTQILGAILDELRTLNKAMEQANEPDPDAEPDPFQTLNGPRL